MNHSRKTSWEEDRYASPGILDVNNDDEELAGPMMGRRSRDRHENAPLLQERLSMSEDRFSEESGFLEPKMASNKKLPACISYIPRCDMKTKSYLCCFSSKRAFMFTCLAFCVIPMLIFFIGGYIYFSPLSLPDTIPSELYTTSAPRILTLNIFMRPPGVKNNQDDFKDERLDYIIKNILPSYDIITIQEAFSYGNRRIDTLARAAFDQGFYYQEASPRHYPWELAGDGGLLLLSRLPIRRADRVEFPRGVHADWLAYKGAIHALIELDSDHAVHVYTTHTQASYDKGGKLNLDDTDVRLSQFALFHSLVAETAKDDGYPIILMGDFNVDAAVHNGSSPEVRSTEGSLSYRMMMDVIKGKGTDLQLISGENNTETKLSYSDDWHLDNLTDVVYEKFGYHPVTFGDYNKLNNGTLVPAETILTHHDQLMTVQSIDRLLWLNNRDGQPVNSSMSLGNITIEKFHVKKNESSLPFTQISDHYGISALLNLK